MWGMFAYSTRCRVQRTRPPPWTPWSSSMRSWYPVLTWSVAGQRESRGSPTSVRRIRTCCSTRAPWSCLCCGWPTGESISALLMSSTTRKVFDVTIICYCCHDIISPVQLCIGPTHGKTAILTLTITYEPHWHYQTRYVHGNHGNITTNQIRSTTKHVVRRGSLLPNRCSNMVDLDGLSSGRLPVLLIGCFIFITSVISYPDRPFYIVESFCGKCSVIIIMHFRMRLFFMNRNSLRHLKLEIALASNELNIETNNWCGVYDLFLRQASYLRPMK